MSCKYVITPININNRRMIFYGFRDEKNFYEVNLTDVGNESILDNIYIGKVRDVVPNINAAFVEYTNGCIGFYSLENNRKHIFLNIKNTDKLVQGDEIIVQVAKEATKTKDPVLTSAINLSGKYVAVTVGKNGIGLSTKINDIEIRNKLKEALKPYVSENYGIVVRTNAASAEISDVTSELEQLVRQWDEIYHKAMTRTVYTVLYKNEPEYIQRIKGIYTDEIDDIVTDSEDIYNMLDDYKSEYTVTLYKDELLPIHKLYNINGTIDELTGHKIWLKCGGYLVIDYTEAMTVIDVNTGKFSKGKNKENTFLKVNLEAAEEIARQIRLRNISGIIIIDFINMKINENADRVMNELRKFVQTDPIRTNVIDMTQLNLVEVTRRKIKHPLHEILMNKKHLT